MHCCLVFLPPFQRESITSFCITTLQQLTCRIEKGSLEKRRRAQLGPNNTTACQPVRRLVEFAVHAYSFSLMALFPSKKLIKFPTADKHATRSAAMDATVRFFLSSLLPPLIPRRDGRPGLEREWRRPVRPISAALWPNLCSIDQSSGLVCFMAKWGTIGTSHPRVSVVDRLLLSLRIPRMRRNGELVLRTKQLIDTMGIRLLCGDGFVIISVRLTRSLFAIAIAIARWCRCRCRKSLLIQSASFLPLFGLTSDAGKHLNKRTLPKKKPSCKECRC